MLLISNSLEMFWLLALMYTLCQFGQQMTDQFSSFEHTIAGTDWYTFPIDMQRHFIIIMKTGQDPVELKGFGNVYCSRETFKKVILFFKLHCTSSYGFDDQKKEKLILFSFRLSRDHFHILQCYAKLYIRLCVMRLRFIYGVLQKWCHFYEHV